METQTNGAGAAATTTTSLPPVQPLPAAAAAPEPPQKEFFFASVHPGQDKPLPDAYNSFCKAVLEYERVTESPVWVIIQSDTSGQQIDSISDGLADAIIDSENQFSMDKKWTLLLHTLGGDPHAGYRIATFLQKATGGFDVVIPKMAKSAGTLISLAAWRIIMGKMSELGPLDMQVRDTESDLWDSALNETKSLQTLSREALLLYAEKMEVLKNVCRGKKFETKNRIATEFVNEMIKPLVEKIDAVHYTKMARVMEIMKKYGRQLMRRAGYPAGKVNKVVESLGDDFPDHSYIIDSREAYELGLRVENPKPELTGCVEHMADFCGEITIVGRITSSLK
jgi:hypothetical protein